MPFLFYVVIVVASLVGVLMGLDRVATRPGPGPAAQSRPVEPPRPMPPSPVQTRAEATSPAAPQPPGNLSQPPPAQPAREPSVVNDRVGTTAQSADDVAPPRCNVPACSSAYQSFRASDCTYVRLSGARILCKK